MAYYIIDKSKHDAPAAVAGPFKTGAAADKAHATDYKGSRRYQVVDGRFLYAHATSSLPRKNPTRYYPEKLVATDRRVTEKFGALVEEMTALNAELLAGSSSSGSPEYKISKLVRSLNNRLFELYSGEWNTIRGQIDRDLYWE